jgi:hypothetical protein
MTTIQILTDLLYKGEINLRLLLQVTGLNQDLFLMKLEDNQFTAEELKAIRQILKERN